VPTLAYREVSRSQGGESSTAVISISRPDTKSRGIAIRIKYQDRTQENDMRQKEEQK
jgi:hypothetical protein